MNDGRENHNIIVVPLNKIYGEEYAIEPSGFIFEDFKLRLVDDETSKDYFDMYIHIGDMQKWTAGDIFVMPLCNNMQPKWNDRMRICYKMRISGNEPDGLRVEAGSITREMTMEEREMYIKEGHDFCCKILEILFFIAWKIENRKKTIVKTDKRSTSINAGKKLFNKTNRKENVKIFLLDELVEYVAENNLYPKSEKHNQINCPCWSVRGHYRTYKSGKKVFVKPFNKGKERGKVAPKQHTYVV